MDDIEFVRFGSEDVVRHKLVQRIVAAYNEYAEKQGALSRGAARRRQELIELDLIDAPEALRPAALAALEAAGVGEGHPAIGLSGPSASGSSTASTAGATRSRT